MEDEGEMRSCWAWVGPKSGVSGVLTKGGLDTEAPREEAV